MKIKEGINGGMLLSPFLEFNIGYLFFYDDSLENKKCFMRSFLWL